MKQLDFYRAVLPGRGLSCLFNLPTRRTLWADSLEQLADLTAKHIDEPNWYFATASFTERRRKQTCVAARRSLHADIDCGAEKFARHPEGAYPTQRDGLVALNGFVQATGLRPTAVVSSGTGLHVYWQLRNDVAVGQWQPLAEALRDVAAAHGLKLDPACTGDSARLLRPPGTLHSNGSRVAVLKVLDKTWGPDELLAVLRAAAPALPPVAPVRAERMDVNAALDLWEPAPASALKAAENCAALRSIAAAKGDVPEPTWRAMLGVVKFAVEGVDLAQEWSAGHPEYDPAATAAKFERYEGTGPTLCATFDKLVGKCDGCPHRGKIKTPLALGRIEQGAEKPPTADAAIADVLAAAPGSGRRTLRPVRAAETGTYYLVIIEPEGRRRLLPISDGDSLDLIRAELRAQGMKRVGRDAVDAAISTLRERAAGAPREPVAVRAAATSSAIYIDAGDGRRVFRIAPCKVETIAAADAPLFLSVATAGALPDPVIPSTAEAALRTVVEWLGGCGVPDDDRLLVVAWLMEAWRPNTVNPILNLVGAAGSGKTSLAYHLKQVVDPTTAAEIVNTKLTADDVAAAASSDRVLTSDNASKLADDAQDFLCGLATGSVVAKRMLYSDATVIHLDVHRPLVITSIIPVASRPDLLERTLFVELPKRGGFSSRERLRVEFERRRPAVLGALLRLLAASLAELERAGDDDPLPTRLVDFALLGQAACRAAGSKCDFIGMLVEKRRRASQAAAAADGFLAALHNVTARWLSEARQGGSQLPAAHPSQNAAQRVHGAAGWSAAQDDGVVSVRFTPAALARAMDAELWGLPPAARAGIPNTPRSVAETLRRSENLLSDLGVEVRRDGNYDRPTLMLRWRGAQTAWCSA